MLIQGHFDVVIVGGGVSGTAVARSLCRYTNASKVILIEKYPEPGLVNSHPLNNAQTQHDGGTETNYTLEHAKQVQRASIPLRNYVDQKNNPLLSHKTKRMVLGVGAEEVQGLRERYEEFKDAYPDLYLVEAEELGRIEPKIMDGRDPNQPVLALASDEGYAINYQLLAQVMLEDAKEANPDLEVSFNTQLNRVNAPSKGKPFVLRTSKGVITADVVIFTAGAFSLYFAQMMDYGKEYAILSVAGSFYTTKHPVLENKVYRVQIPGMPFAAIHGDPDILDATVTRFGPTTKPLPLMERYHPETLWPFLKIFFHTWDVIIALIVIIFSGHLLGYVIKNWAYDQPRLGPMLFAREIRAIVPKMKASDLVLRRRAGGLRPQLVNIKERRLEMGDKTLVGDRCIFNTTPSPGASVCMANAERDVKIAIQWLGEGYYFDEEAYQRELMTSREVHAPR